MTALQSRARPRLYFACGSNLWREQMMLRCPKSTYVGVGHLAQYRWIISDRGYANIVSSTKPEDEVYGHVYNLTSSSDED
ncbi:hypothetical protein HO173_004117 [Letharia columbiana]|uniref:Gamma-glutamylcyclotransferase n=1 Tax=Letharia columbiana TaxID=112416 RepID=A0A8H6G062_9LECA|nr:uncharacterized protein HO173_004117 [Letharia columbiana]KAF6237916.1 hypothetical protein HO173_004117 [Letharia columbiana]